MREEITVLLVDDHALVRRGFRRILDDEAHITVVGEASDGIEAVQMACGLEPKVVLMDCAMPRMSGLVATKEIVRARPETAILMLSMHAEDTWVRQAAEAGARGYILKNAMDLDLGSAIKQVAGGELLFAPQTSRRAGSIGARDCELTPRELEILQLIVDGKSNKEIAALLSLSDNTVGVHRAHIMRGLGIHKTAELVAYAIRKRLVNIP
jgi:two-component system, NarL family, response regulator NreC